MTIALSIYILLYFDDKWSSIQNYKVITQRFNSNSGYVAIYI